MKDSLANSTAGCVCICHSTVRFCKVWVCRQGGILRARVGYTQQERREPSWCLGVKPRLMGDMLDKQRINLANQHHSTEWACLVRSNRYSNHTVDVVEHSVELRQGEEEAWGGGSDTTSIILQRHMAPFRMIKNRIALSAKVLVHHARQNLLETLSRRKYVWICETRLFPHHNNNNITFKKNQQKHRPDLVLLKQNKRYSLKTHSIWPVMKTSHCNRCLGVPKVHCEVRLHFEEESGKCIHICRVSSLSLTDTRTYPWPRLLAQRVWETCWVLKKTPVVACQECASCHPAFRCRGGGVTIPRGGGLCYAVSPAHCFTAMAEARLPWPWYFWVFVWLGVLTLWIVCVSYTVPLKCPHQNVNSCLSLCVGG